ncbi:MAG: hypothetical protein PHQ12_01925 [Chthoniobacteraceae bacterium]|nr:hypothetical protein [Chthoniobacteraceae bacterium]
MTTLSSTARSVLRKKSSASRFLRAFPWKTAALLSLFGSALLSPLGRAQGDPPRTIDVGSLPATVVDEVVIPVPTEVFGVLDKLGSPNWHEVLRPVKIENLGKRPQVALLLGVTIAEGFIAVEAQEPEEVKKIGRQVLTLSKAIGVQKSVISRTQSIIEAADKKDWKTIRLEFDGASKDVKQAMIELEDAQLAQLVSLGGWLRGTEALTQVVTKNYTKDGAELLHQPAIIDFFERKLDELNPRLKSSPIVKKIARQLPELRKLIEPAGSITPQKVEKIHTMTAELVKAISSQE